MDGHTHTHPLSRPLDLSHIPMRASLVPSPALRGCSVLPDYWVQRSLAELGQSMGVTSTGLLLLRMTDPENQTPALAAFSYKQVAHPRTPSLTHTLTHTLTPSLTPSLTHTLTHPLTHTHANALQLIHEPIVGGGLWTASVLPFLKAAGIWPVVGVAFAAMTFWFLLYAFYFRPRFAR